MQNNPKTIKTITLEEINRLSQNPAEFAESCERVYRENIEKAAQSIAECHAEKPLVLLSGPSGSGKTTTAYRIAKRLAGYNIKSVVISMDDYFVPGDICKVTDLESPERVDSELLQKDLLKLAGGEEVRLPKFNFSDRTRRQGARVRCDGNTVVIIEGIHALNPQVTGSLHDKATFIYVSVRTRIEAPNGEKLHPSKIRLLRRLSRDKLFRGRQLSQTLEKFESVQRGENRYIMPYKELADFDVDTFFAYELPVYKTVLLQLCPEFDECVKRARHSGELSRFVDACSALPVDVVPEDSLIKEFIG